MVLCLSMIVILNSKITPEQLKEVSEDIEGYVKFVVDIEKKILAAGGKMHTDGEKKLLEAGSKQSNLWGGGWDLETNELDYDSMINLRPSQGNPSREVLSAEIREQMTEVVKNLLLS